MIDGVVGITIWTEDLGRVVLFYEKTLGLMPNSRHEGFVSFLWGDMNLTLGYHDAVQGFARDSYRMMINFGTGDIHALYETLVAQKVEVLRPPARESWGGWVATFRDPDGNIFQLIQQPSDKQDHV